MTPHKCKDTHECGYHSNADSYINNAVRLAVCERITPIFGERLGDVPLRCLKIGILL